MTINFNPEKPRVMHLDINSCFATIEQQANPFLRNKPIVVAAYTGDKGCILAASIEAKKIGIKTGLTVKEGKDKYSNLIILSPDPQKYRDVHLKIKHILDKYTPKVIPKSIDEFVMDFKDIHKDKSLKDIGISIKKDIKDYVGEWISVSIGIGTNKFLAKTASNLRKPDGLEEINYQNHLDIFSKIPLMDLWGIKRGNASRLGSCEIYTTMDFYNANLKTLINAFKESNANTWYLRIHGYEEKDYGNNRKSFGNSYSLPKPYVNIEDISPILYKLVEKTGRRLRKENYKAYGIHLSILYRDGSFWHEGKKLEKSISDTRKIYQKLFNILIKSPRKPIRIIAESVYYLVRNDVNQLQLFEDTKKEDQLTKTLDTINDKWGEFVILPAKMLNTKQYAPDRISFGGIRELKEI